MGTVVMAEVVMVEAKVVVVTVETWEVTKEGVMAVVMVEVKAMVG